MHIVCATNEDLAEAVARGTLREDLHMRLKGGVIALPPLRERFDEITYVIKSHCDELGIAPERAGRTEGSETARSRKVCDREARVR